MAFTSTYINFMGFDFLLEVDFDITYRGCRATYWDIAEDPEWEIENIVMRLDGTGAPFEATGKLFECLAESRQMDAAILKYLDDTNDLDWLEYDEDFYREEC